MSTKPKVVFFGTPDFVVPVLESLIKNFEVSAVVTTPDTIQGRKKLLTPTPVKAFSQRETPQGLVLVPEQWNNKTIKQLKNLFPDLFVVAAYGKILPKAVLDIPKYGSINIHPSLLPKYRGPSPIQSTLLSGDKEIGITIIQMDEEVDHGPILYQKSIPLSSSDTFQSLHISLFQDAASVLPDVISQIFEGTIKPQEQNHNDATYCGHIARQDGYFDIDNPPSKEKLDRMIRAYFPWPTAWSKLQIANSKWQIVKFLPEKRIQLEGGKQMSIKDFLNGYPEIKEKILKLFSV